MQTRELRICVVGLGSIARTHLAALRALPALRTLPFQPVVESVVSRRAGELRSQLAALGVRHASTSLEAVLAEHAPDAVVVASSNDRHLAEARAILRAGLPLYLEKPLGRGPAEAAEIAGLAGAAAAPVQVGLVMRYHPGVAWLRALLAAGAVGELRQARLTSFHGSYLDPDRPLSWRLSRELAGGGALLDLGLHLVDLARHLFGGLSLAAASARTFVPERPGGHVDVDDWAWLELLTGSGATVSVETSRIALGREGSSCEVYGTEGSLLLDLGSSSPPGLRRFDGRESEWLRKAQADLTAARVRELLPPPRESLGTFTDSHAAALHHFLLRVTGPDPVPGLAPLAADSAAAEALVAEAVAAAAGRELAHA